MAKTWKCPPRTEHLDVFDFTVLAQVERRTSLGAIAAALKADPSAVADSVAKLADYYARQHTHLSLPLAKEQSKLAPIQVQARRSVDRIRACLARLA